MKKTMALLALLATSFSAQAGFTPEDSYWEFTFVSSNFYKVEYEILEQYYDYIDPQIFSLDQNLTLKYILKGSNPFKTTLNDDYMALYINGRELATDLYFGSYGGQIEFYAFDSIGIPTDWIIDIWYEESWSTYEKTNKLLVTPSESKVSFTNKTWWTLTNESAHAATGTWSAYYYPGIAAVPEPSTNAMLLAGLTLICWSTCKKKSKTLQ